MVNSLALFSGGKNELVKKSEGEPGGLQKSGSSKLKNSNIILEAFGWIKAFLLPMLTVMLLLTFVFGTADVDGESMMDTLHDNDRVILSKFLYEPAGGDIVVVSHGQQLDKHIIKRVIATEGQSVKIDYDNNQVFVNGTLIDEPYLAKPYMPDGYDPMIDDPFLCDGEIPDKIPEGKVFVMGDNRNYSSDSRSKVVGLVNKTDIIGKAQLIYMPFDRFRYLY